AVVDTVQGKAEEIVRELTLHVGERSTLLCVSLVHPSSSHVRYVQRSIVEADGKIHWWNAVCGGSTVHHDLVSEVVGENGESTIDWVFLAQGKQQYDLSVQNIFHSSHGRGEVTVKGVASDHAHVGCHGAIVIGEGGGGTNTHLTQHVLMLDATTKVDAVPALEIKTNDVKASHSATVTKVSEDDLFYMTSRGLLPKEARQLYIDGFLGERIARIPVAPVWKEVIQILGREK
ncbi:SufD family Fe-S cluster assembly protein, partial [Candidatus Peregrinibacteria bacterium]|nr:SufD family Fe-S cluster assembly protein [Candidatus Peregrinibacteria bacterium]